MSNSSNVYSQHPLPSSSPKPSPSLPSHQPRHSSSLHKSSGCILKGAKIFTLSKVVKGFCVHTGADKEEAPSAWPKENCWNKSAHTKTQRDNGAGAGPDPETETHCAPDHTYTNTYTYTQSAWLGTKSAHWLIFIFGAHIVQDIQYQKTENIITPPCVQPCGESHAWNQTNNKKKRTRKSTDGFTWGSARQEQGISETSVLCKVVVCINLYDLCICVLNALKRLDLSKWIMFCYWLKIKLFTVCKLHNGQFQFLCALCVCVEQTVFH